MLRESLRKLAQILSNSLKCVALDATFGHVVKELDPVPNDVRRLRRVLFQPVRKPHDARNRIKFPPKGIADDRKPLGKLVSCEVAHVFGGRRERQTPDSNGCCLRSCCDVEEHLSMAITRQLL